MNPAPVCCMKCKASLAGEGFNLPGLTPCPSCGAPLQVEVFPALFRRLATGRAGDTLIEETESSCFYHPEKRAVAPCEACGRFLCALCDCELDDRHLCPACLETGKKKGKIKSLENHRTLYDGMALALAVAAFIPPFIYFSFMTAPLAIFIAFRHWNTPTSIIHRTKIRFVIAVVIASLQIAGWVALIYFLATKRRA
jgi:hypothetical protein